MNRMIGAAKNTITKLLVDLVEVARMVHQMTKAKGRRMAVEAAVFNDKAKKIRMGHYDYTHQLTRADFDETRDSFNYTKEIPPIWKQAFVASCQPLLPVEAVAEPVKAVA